MHPSTKELVTRVRRLPEVLRQTLASQPPAGLASLGAKSVLITGIGTSEGVAHFAEALFRHELRIRVTTLPVSSFISEDVKSQGQMLVILSQELSQNASLAMSRAREFELALLITSCPADDARLAGFRAAGGLVWTLPPAGERDFLVRVMGPVAAALALFRLGTVAAGRAPPMLDALPARVEEAIEYGFALAQRWPLEVRRAPLVASGWYVRCIELLAWSWMEAWFVESPPTWDVLQLAHGPWQAMFDSTTPLLLLERPDDVPGLWQRLETMVKAPGAKPRELVRLVATLPAPLAFFEHAGMVLGLLAGVLERTPGDLTAWPGRGTDGSLYDLGSD